MIRSQAGSGTDPAPPSPVAPAAASLTLARSSRAKGITSLQNSEGIAKPICKKTAAPPPNSGKNHYLERLNHPSRSMPWQYFTGDDVSEWRRHCVIELPHTSPYFPIAPRIDYSSINDLEASSTLSSTRRNIGSGAPGPAGDHPHPH